MGAQLVLEVQATQTEIGKLITSLSRECGDPPLLPFSFYIQIQLKHAYPSLRNSSIGFPNYGPRPGATWFSNPWFIRRNATMVLHMWRIASKWLCYMIPPHNQELICENNTILQITRGVPARHAKLPGMYLWNTSTWTCKFLIWKCGRVIFST